MGPSELNEVQCGAVRHSEVQWGTVTVKVIIGIVLLFKSCSSEGRIGGYIIRRSEDMK